MFQAGYGRQHPEMERRGNPGGADPPGIRRTRPQPSERREHAGVVRPYLVTGIIPADGGEAVAAGAAIGNRGGAAHHHQGHHRRADHEGVIRKGHHAGRTDRCGESRP